MAEDKMVEDKKAKETEVKKRKDKQQKNLERVKAMAAEKNARCIICNNPETHALADIAISLDQAVKRLRNRMLTDIPLEKAIPVLSSVNKALAELEDITREVAELTRMDYYKTPRLITSIRKNLCGETDEGGEKKEKRGGKNVPLAAVK